MLGLIRAADPSPPRAIMTMQSPDDTPAGPPASVLIAAGPTHEPIDAVRYIANRSSGQLGRALARAALDRGCRTTLLLGPEGPSNIQTGSTNADPEQAPDSSPTTVRFRTSHDLEALLMKHVRTCDIFIMAAAVADYRPAKPHPGKLPRTDESLTLTLEPVPDLLARATGMLKPGAVAIGFALEEDSGSHERARAKMARKGCQAIVLNPLATMDSTRIDATILFADGRVPLACGPMPKPEFAGRLIGVALGLWASARGIAS